MLLGREFPQFISFIAAHRILSVVLHIDDIFAAGVSLLTSGQALQPIREVDRAKSLLKQVVVMLKIFEVVNFTVL